MFARRLLSPSGLLKGTAYAGCGLAGLLASQAYYVKVNFTLPPDASGPTAGVARAGQSPPPTRHTHGKPSRKTIVFMGDSVVKGVGCRRVGEGPTLPRHVAEVVAEQLGVEVGWRALGETGADIPMLREQFIPLLRREVERCAQSGERVDAVVVLCGLNDMKECFLYANCPVLHPKGSASRGAGSGKPLRVIADDVRFFHPGQVRQPAATPGLLPPLVARAGRDDPRGGGPPVRRAAARLSHRLLAALQPLLAALDARRPELGSMGAAEAAPRGGGRGAAAG